MTTTTTTAVTPANRRRPGVRAAVTALANEVGKGLLFVWRERAQIPIEIPLWFVVFVLMNAIVGSGEQIAAGGRLDFTNATHATTRFVGFAAFVLFYLQSSKLYWRLLGEIQSGTLEQVYLSPLPSWLLTAAGRVVATVLEALVTVTAVFLGVSVIVDLDLPWRAQALLPLLLFLVATIGYALVLGGLVLVWRRVEMLAEGLAVVAFLFAGIFLPLAVLPGWLATVGRLFPITHSMEYLRAVLLDGRSLTTMGGDGGLVWAAATALGWLLAGITAFSAGQRTARRQGSLGQH
jgi:ABC-2 type transport system permease protein